MIKKRGVFIIVFLILITGIIFFSLINAEQETKKNKISQEVYEKLEESEETRVIINLEIQEEKGFLFKTKKTNSEIEIEKEKTKEEIREEVGEENVKHVFDDMVAVEISEKELNELSKNSNIGSIIIDRPVRAFLQNSVPFINASSVWPIKISGINITGIDETICILDTGINFSHSDLNGKNKTCIIDCITPTEGCVENCSLADDNGHGTHVAGIAAASGSIKGIAIGASLIGIKVLDSNGEGSSSDVIAGINWCVNNASKYNISVISMSLGDCSNHTTYCNSDSMAPSINTATGKNISVIVAAGNGPGGGCSGITNTNGPSSPACVENATAVGAVNSNNVISYQRGALFELLAPGVSINSTTLNGGYTSMSGTSMAAPHVAGVFALFRQFFKLQNNRVPTSSEIKTQLNNTGIRIDDSSGSGYNFTRIDIYSALISIDNSNPVVNLTFPNNNTTQFSQNVTFRCSANDVLLKNITLYVWNSSGIFNSTLRQVTGVNAEIEVNLTLAYDSYSWNCLAYDSKGNFSFASSNYSVSIGYISVNLNSPLNNLFTNQNQTFNCSAETEQTKKLTNLTFYLWNSTILIFNLSQNISGISNSTLFQYNFTREQEYKWNCLAYDNVSQSSFFSSNYTITYDTTKPSITLIAPENAVSYTSSSQEITFQYNVSDANLANCSLIINNIISLTNSSINSSLTQSFIQTFTPASYSWNINCSDRAKNQENSSNRSFTITAPSTQISSSGGGGGGGSVSNTYTLSIKQVESGYSQELKKEDKIKFYIINKEEQEQHIIIVKILSNNSITLTIQSNITETTLSVGEEEKFNLTSDKFYDLYIKLNSIRNNKANLTVKTIHEEIPIIRIMGEMSEEETGGGKGEESEETEERLEIKTTIKEIPAEMVRARYLIYFILIFIAIIIIVLYFIKRKNYKIEIKKIKKK